MALKERSRAVEPGTIWNKPSLRPEQDLNSDLGLHVRRGNHSIMLPLESNKITETCRQQHIKVIDASLV